MYPDATHYGVSFCYLLDLIYGFPKLISRYS
ncbi:MAG: hypothetical protein H6Q42_2017, partial [Deltaproteobacteria bacterium]|nr:hypothetical protein [Deltaproteobacteria bacterium]